MDTITQPLSLILYKNCRIILGDLEAGQKLLMTRDDYIQGLSPFDLQSKMSVTVTPSAEEFMEFQAQNLLPWANSDLTKWQLTIPNLKSKLEAFSNIPIPEIIHLNLTTGKEEGGAAYTRGMNGIFLPTNMVRGLNNIEEVLTHEIWHIISRNISPELKNRVYGCIGFKDMGHELAYPEELTKISNPDAPIMKHYIEVNMPDGSNVCLIPIICSNNPIFRPGFGVTFFQYLQLSLLVVKKSEGGTWHAVKTEHGKRELREVASMPQHFWSQIGRNTSYMIHPEETVADNFMYLIQQHGPPKIKSPEILEKLREILA